MSSRFSPVAVRSLFNTSTLVVTVIFLLYSMYFGGASFLISVILFAETSIALLAVKTQFALGWQPEEALRQLLAKKKRTSRPTDPSQNTESTPLDAAATRTSARQITFCLFLLHKNTRQGCFLLLIGLASLLLQYQFEFISDMIASFCLFFGAIDVLYSVYEEIL